MCLLVVRIGPLRVRRTRSGGSRQ